MSLLNNRSGRDNNALVRTGGLVGLLVVALLSTACGFQLRGSVALPAALSSIQLEGVSDYSDLGIVLRNNLVRSGSQLVKQASAGDSILHVSQNQFQRRVLSVNSQGTPNEYELRYLLGFELRDSQGNPVLAKQQIDILRDYRFDADNVLAKGDEETRIKKEMLRIAVAQMMRRIDIGMKNKPVTSATDSGLGISPEHQVDKPVTPATTEAGP